jgi:hypothetical protein
MGRESRRGGIQRGKSSRAFQGGVSVGRGVRSGNKLRNSGPAKRPALHISLNLGGVCDKVHSTDQSRLSLHPVWVGLWGLAWPQGTGVISLLSLDMAMSGDPPPRKVGRLELLAWGRREESICWQECGRRRGGAVPRVGERSAKGRLEMSGVCLSFWPCVCVHCACLPLSPTSGPRGFS